MTEIHVVGAGVAGLTVAGMLPRTWDVHLHEAAWQGRAVPTVFGMWPAAMRVVERLGLAEAVHARATHLEDARVHDRTGRVLAAVGGQDVWLISRPDLIDLLRRRLPEHVTVHHGRVEGPDQLGGDLVVGADGVHSVVRREWWGRAAAPRTLGVTAVRGVIDEPTTHTSLGEYWGSGVMFGMTPRATGGTNWFATVPRRRFSGAAEALEHLRRRLASFADVPQQVLAAAIPEQTLVNDLWASRWPGRLLRDRTVLVGDAAHAMSPSLGRGACESLLDAYVLGEALRTLPRRAALRRYERSRLLPPQAVRVASTAALRVATARRERVRNALVSALPTPRPPGAADLVG
ncbi:FAD-dependent monooxygenase [Georgenia alba]|uniref:FAD-dependent monooxygenase n=1 Tax=Georgenia alba TaxID=2233858 RepID=A0ABW2Q2S7_9MICO